ncbi:MAG: DUF4159 domain-containing protein [Elusimicrobia bacterium]|nr:DUF4159 domain-containing protein [Elusimicrobiota bacterium]
MKKKICLYAYMLIRKYVKTFNRITVFPYHRIAVVILLLTHLLTYSLTHRLYGQQGGKFVFTQLRYSGNWDTRPTAWDRVSEYLLLTTSVKIIPERRVVEITDKELFWSPVLIITGDTTFPELTDKEIEILKKYLLCGGMIFIDDSSGKTTSGFAKSIRNTIGKILPENPIEKIPMDNAVYWSFYLLRHVSGRIVTNKYLEGCKIGERYSIIYSQNDLFGAWVKDNLGNYIYPCTEQQRWEAKKLTINIILYVLTGTYKSDAVHQPTIQRKLR